MCINIPVHTEKYPAIITPPRQVPVPYGSVAEPEPNFLLGRSCLFKAAPAASFRQAKKKSLVLVFNMTKEQFIKEKTIQKKTLIKNIL